MVPLKGDKTMDFIRQSVDTRLETGKFEKVRFYVYVYTQRLFNRVESGLKLSSKMRECGSSSIVTIPCLPLVEEEKDGGN